MNKCDVVSYRFSCQNWSMLSHLICSIPILCHEFTIWTKSLFVFAFKELLLPFSSDFSFLLQFLNIYCSHYSAHLHLDYFILSELLVWMMVELLVLPQLTCFFFAHLRSPGPLMLKSFLRRWRSFRAIAFLFELHVSIYFFCTCNRSCTLFCLITTLGLLFELILNLWKI